jgi:hypothetical protein
LAVAIVVVGLLLLSNMGRDKDVVSVAQSGPERVGPLEVSATSIDLGRVPLDRWVNPTFLLRNVSEGPVTITIPRAGVETLEGC